MFSLSSATRVAAALSLLAVVGPAAAGAQQSPVLLQLPAAARIDGQAYALETSQVVEIDYHGALHSAERGVRFGFRFSGSSAEGAERVNTSLRIDSLRVRLVTPHGEDVAQSHGLTGSSLALTYARRGGPRARVDKAKVSLTLGLLFRADPKNRTLRIVRIKGSPGSESALS